MKCYPAMLMNAVSRFYGADPEPAAGRGGDAAFSGVSRGGAPWATSAVLGVRRAPGPPSSPLLPSPHAGVSALPAERQTLARGRMPTRTRGWVFSRALRRKHRKRAEGFGPRPTGHETGAAPPPTSCVTLDKVTQAAASTMEGCCTD